MDEHADEPGHTVFPQLAFALDDLRVCCVLGIHGHFTH